MALELSTAYDRVPEQLTRLRAENGELKKALSRARSELLEQKLHDLLHLPTGQRGKDDGIMGEFDTWLGDEWFTVPLHIFNFSDLGLRF